MNNPMWLTVEGLTEIDGRGFYAVPELDRMAPFLMNVTSDGDRWMFISSTGSLTAGRGDASGALFPYLPDDRLHDSAGVIGPATAVRGLHDQPVWTPFLGPTGARRLAKAVTGDSIIFEEAHPVLPLRYRSEWRTSASFGFVRTVSLLNAGDRSVRFEIADGLMDVLAHGLEPRSYQSMSNLTNAYKRGEVIDPAHKLALFSLETAVSDRPEPSEVLRATAVWSCGFEGGNVTPGARDVWMGRPHFLFNQNQ